MILTHYLLAAILLTSFDVKPTHFEVISKPIQQLAVSWQILDSRETKEILSRKDDFESDLLLVRRRQKDLFNAPFVEDADRFISRIIVNEYLSFNRAYRNTIDIRKPVELIHWQQIRIMLQQTENLYQIWDQVREARCDYYYVAVRRLALKKLRELVGDEAYYSGVLPPPVPLWFFDVSSN